MKYKTGARLDESIQNTMITAKRAIRQKQRHERRQSGVVLVLVLVVVVMVSFVAYAFSDFMLVEQGATQQFADQVQSHYAVESGVEATRVLLAKPLEDQLADGGIFNNPEYFQGKIVNDDPIADFRVRVSVLSTEIDDYGGPMGTVYGLRNESARLNINTLLSLAESKSSEATASGGSSEGSTNGTDSAESTGTESEEGLPDESADESSESSEEMESTVSTNPRDMLMVLPGMSEDVADAILDWLDKDDEPREFGAEAESYTAYAPRNGPIESIDELLLVRGVLPEMLYGMDTNRNGMLDQNELASDMAGMADASMELGWAGYLTLHSAERNTAWDGLPRVYLNYSSEAEELATSATSETDTAVTDATDMEILFDQLMEVFDDPDWATFIVAYRQAGPAESNENNQQEEEEGGDSADEAVGPDGDDSGGGGQNNSGRESGQNGSGDDSEDEESDEDQDNTEDEEEEEEPEPIDGREVDLTVVAETEIDNVLDLIDAQVRITFVGEDEETLVQAPFSSDPADMATYLPLLMDFVTVEEAETIPGRININQAPLAVIAAIPGMTEELAMAIINARTPDPNAAIPEHHDASWILAEGLVTIEEMRKLMPYMTGGGSVYRANIVGFFDTLTALSRAEVVFDATTDVPRVISWKDMTHLGRGYDAETLGVEVVEN